MHPIPKIIAVSGAAGQIGYALMFRIAAGDVFGADQRDWVLGSGGRWVSMGLISDGAYAIPEGLVCGAPAVCRDGGVERVGGLEIDAFARQMIARTVAELSEEREAVQALLA